MMISRWKAVCAYDGTDFNGWQSQVDGRTIQDILERRMSQLFNKHHRIHGSGRTDAGTHAKGQVFHFDCQWPKETEVLHHAIQSGLPDSIQILSIRRVSRSFHARFSATGKLYRYQIFKGQAPPHLSRYYWSCPLREMQVDRLKECLNRFHGWHDFRAFCANPGAPYEDTWRYIARVELYENKQEIRIAFEGNGFLYKMVRSMVGAAVAFASGQLNMAEFESLLAARIPRGNLIQTAPAKGLSLDKVYYRPRPYPTRYLKA